MIIETWVAIMFLAFIGVMGIVCALGWLAKEQELEECRKENESIKKEIHHLRGKLSVMIATEFYNEGKKK